MNAHEADKTRTDRVLLLSIGLLSGFLIAAGVFFALYHGSPSSDRVATAAAATAPAATAEMQTPALPSPQPAQQFETASAFQPQPPMYDSTAATPAPAMIYEPAQGQGMVQQDPATMMQTGTTGYTDMAMAPAGSRGYVNFSSQGSSDNPSWGTTRNGLIGNPAVDPPSSKGRAYQLNGSY
jgi:hypothetical protein